MVKRPRRSPAPKDPPGSAGGDAAPSSGTTADAPGAVAIGKDNWGIVSTGPNATNVQTVLPPEALRPVSEVTAPSRLVNVPSAARLFVGRHDDLTALQTALDESEDPVVVHGLGGVGKSTLAARYATAQADRRNPVWWITADTPASLQAGLAALATALQPELTRALPLEALAERALTWLSCQNDWLLVLDNVTDPAHLTPVLNRALSGRVLITSRLGTGWHRLGARVLHLDVLTPAQAVELLARITTGGTDRHDPALEGAADLVEELGCLPLAIEQAAAYLHQTRLTPRAYLELLSRQPAAMFDQAAAGGDPERTIARLWRLTLARLTEVPHALQVLRVLAWYGAEAVPRTLLAPLADPAKLTTALGALAAYNMITLTPQTVTVHRLVQAVTRAPDPTDPHRRPTDIDQARHQAIDLLGQALPPDHQDPTHWPAWRTLLPHIDALAARTTVDDDGLALLLNEAGTFLHDQGAIHRAIAYHRRALTDFQRLLGDDHPLTLTSRNNLALAYQTSGDSKRAIPLLKQTLADKARVLGADHPHTLTTRNNLALAYQEAGDLKRAIPLLEQALTDKERVLGADHPRTRASRDYLADTYRQAEESKRAISPFPLEGHGR